MIEVSVAIIGGVFGLLMWWLDNRRRKDNKRTQETLGEIRYHTSNDHGTNMRDDLDRAIAVGEATSRKVDEIVFLVKEVLVPEMTELSKRAGRTESRLDEHIADAA